MLLVITHLDNRTIDVVSLRLDQEVFLDNEKYRVK